MKKLKKSRLVVLLISLALVIGLVVSGCAAPAPAPTPTPAPTPAPPEVIKLHAATVVPEGRSPGYRYLAKWKEEVAAKSGGRIEIVLHLAGELGSEREYVTSAQAGTLDFALTSITIFAGFTDAFIWEGMFYLIKDDAHATRVISDSKVVERLDTLQDIDLIGIGYSSLGMKGIYTREKIEHPADLEGLIIRTMENPVPVAAYKAWGANPTPLPYGELYSALEYGTVDGADNPIANYMSGKFYEPAPYFIFTDHVYILGMMFGSKKTWDGLSSEDQKILMDASKVAFLYATDLLAKDQAEDIAKLKEYGIEFTYPDKEEFSNALGDALKPFEEEIGEDFIAYIRGL